MEQVQGRLELRTDRGGVEGHGHVSLLAGALLLVTLGYPSMMLHSGGNVNRHRELLTSPGLAPSIDSDGA
jgi:hypothetical protein